MFPIVAAATIVVGELRNYSYARDQFLLAGVGRAGFADYGGDACCPAEIDFLLNRHAPASKEEKGRRHGPCVIASGNC